MPAEMRSWDEGKPVNKCGDLLSYCAEEQYERRRDEDINYESQFSSRDNPPGWSKF